MTVMKLLMSLLLLCCAGLSAQEPVAIRVDLDKPLGAWKPVTNWFGYDELNYTTTANGEKLLAELARTSPQPVYVRAHHMFTSGDGKPALKWSSTNIYTIGPDGKPFYNFAIVDQTFDAWLKAGVRPMVELGFMPEALASGTNAYYLPYPHTIEGSVQSPPKDYAKWQELCRVFVAHLVSRYGRERVAQWYFEVWNEPNIPYWHGTEAEYFRLYDYSVAGVRAALPGAKVGGPATTSPRSEKAAEYLKDFLNHVANDTSAANGQALPLDFISFHVKGQPTLIHDADGATHVRMGLDKELTDADRGFAVIAASPFRQAPIILSEADPEGCAACSAKENPANGYRNGPLYAAYTAAAMKGLTELADKHGVNLLGMLTWAFEFEDRASFEGFRTLATNGVDKPVLNVFRMAGKLSGERIAATSSAAEPEAAIEQHGVNATEIDVLATKSARGAEVLVWSYRDDDLAGPDQPCSVIVSGVPASVTHAELEVFTVDASHSNSYSAWKAMGSPAHPTAEQTAKLQAAGQLAQLGSTQRVVVKDGAAMLPCSMPAQATTLFTLRW